jgi:hypothetical protein
MPLGVEPIDAKKGKTMARVDRPARRRPPYATPGALVILLALMQSEPTSAGTLPFLSAQAAPAQPSDSATPPPKNDEKSKGEKTSVPATVVDERQLESVLGIEALSAKGENMGRIVDVFVDRAGEVRAAIIDFGGFLGLGTRQIAVDWRSLRFEPNGKAGTVMVNLTRDQLRVAPVYKSGEPIVVVGGPEAKP